MKIQIFQADEEGYIRVHYLIRPLFFGLYKDRPSFWGVTDPVGKQGVSCNIIACEDGQTVDQTIIGNYRTTLINDKIGKVWHLFEEPPKILSAGPGVPEFKLPKG